ncbi:MAG: hypothetical protein RhofKO_18130 [Rhodothermales bacterium]
MKATLSILCIVIGFALPSFGQAVMIDAQCSGAVSDFNDAFREHVDTTDRFERARRNKMRFISSSERVTFPLRETYAAMNSDTGQLIVRCSRENCIEHEKQDSRLKQHVKEWVYSFEQPITRQDLRCLGDYYNALAKKRRRSQVRTVDLKPVQRAKPRVANRLQQEEPPTPPKRKATPPPSPPVTIPPRSTDGQGDALMSRLDAEAEFLRLGGTILEASSNVMRALGPPVEHLKQAAASQSVAAMRRHLSAGHPGAQAAMRHFAKAKQASEQGLALARQQNLSAEVQRWQSVELLVMTMTSNVEGIANTFPSSAKASGLGREQMGLLMKLGVTQIEAFGKTGTQLEAKLRR